MVVSGAIKKLFRDEQKKRDQNTTKIISTRLSTTLVKGFISQMCPSLVYEAVLLLEDGWI